MNRTFVNLVIVLCLMQFADWKYGEVGYFQPCGTTIPTGLPSLLYGISRSILMTGLISCLQSSKTGNYLVFLISVIFFTVIYIWYLDEKYSVTCIQINANKIFVQNCFLIIMFFDSILHYLIFKWWLRPSPLSLFLSLSLSLKI